MILFAIFTSAREQEHTAENEQRRTKTMFNLIDKLGKMSHEIEEKDKIISELQSLLKFRTNENKSLYKEINRLREVIEIKDAKNIRLSEENNQLKFRNKMLINTGINSVYGMHCCKNRWVYTDTDSIKPESEDSKHDGNN